jgi:large subunit ribosomal protein L3
MKKGLIGKKLGMTQVFTEDGMRIPVTVVEAGPCVVIQKKTTAKDGYNAIQVGFANKDSNRSSRALVGHCKSAEKGAFRYFREIRTEDIDQYNVGDIITAEIFTEGELIDVTGTSIGKGYQGVVKRWNFQGGRATHGSRFHRAPGSIGSSATPSRVFKNTKLPGHMGNARVTVQRLVVVRVDAAENLLMIKGAVPGPANALVMIKDSVKAKQ